MNQNYYLFRVGTCGLLAKLATGFKISFMVGSFAAFFSASGFIMPLSGAFTGLEGSSYIACALLLMRFFSSSFSLSMLAHHIPGLFGAYYWASDSLFIRVIVPLACMVLFIMHPVGYGAFLYSFYWLIPVALYFSQKTLFREALGSTFTAHAVGSVIWLYTVPMISEQWISLIPVVALERFMFAAGMTVLYSVLNYFFRSVHTRSFPYFQPSH